jgi:hypothetical protein
MNYMNYTELLSELRQLDEVQLLELLEINSEQLVDAFADEIVERQQMLRTHIRESQ